MSETITVAGGTGFIGKRLCKMLLDQGYDVRILTRHPPNRKDDNYQYQTWDPVNSQVGSIAEFVSGSRAVINLSGEPIAQRWTFSVKQRIFASRLYSTSTLANAIRESDSKPEVFLNMSSVDYYGNSILKGAGEEQSEGTGFLCRLYSQLENETLEADFPHTRVVIARTGMVVGAPTGAFGVYSILAKRGITPDYGKKIRWISWISLDDLCRALIWLVETGDATQIYNIATETPYNKTELMLLLSKLLDVPPKDEVTETYGSLFKSELVRFYLFSSQRALPKRLTQAGFEFKSHDIVREVTSRIAEIFQLTHDI